MTAGEKIKLFRSLKKISQKNLAELSGVSEIAIRKYEAGARNPKPEPLKKIAKALGFNENFLLDIPLNTLDIETIGDFMAIFFLLQSRINMTFYFQNDENEKIMPSTLKVHFNDDKINENLARWINETQETEDRINVLMSGAQDHPEERNEREQQISILTFLNESLKQEMMKNDEVLPPK